jgi:hypothetical protein
MMETTIYDLELVFKTELLGSCPQKDIVAAFLQDKRQFEMDDEEEEALAYGDQLEKGTTFFYRHPETDDLVLSEHQIKGFLKKMGQTYNGRIPVNAKVKAKVNEEVDEEVDEEANKEAKKDPKKPTKMVSMLRNKIYTLVFVRPRWIPILDAGTPEFLERPLRAETAKGPRTALARSEMLLPGCRVLCELHVKPGEIGEHVLRALLDEGQYWGIGQWHSGGYGLFDYTLVKRD